MNKLEKLLYRKSSIENRMNIWSKGIKIYSNYIDNNNKLLKDGSDWEKIESEINIHEKEPIIKHYITSWKLCKRELEEYIIPEIEKIVPEDEKKEIQFSDLEKEMKELSEYDLFGSHNKKPDNVELIEINEDIKKHMTLLKNIIEESVKKSIKSNDTYEIAKLELDVFKANLHLISNHKRLVDREEYYMVQFKPQYDKDYKEGVKYIDAYLKRAEELSKIGVDIKLGFLLQEYEKNKHDDEKFVLAYTTIKTRVDQIRKEMRRNKGAFKGKMKLAKDIISV